MPSAALLVLGTNNRKQGSRAGRAAGAASALEFKTLADFPQALEVDETGDSFAGQCRAQGHARRPGILKPVGAGRGQRHRGRRLGGAPGIYSARYCRTRCHRPDEQRSRCWPSWATRRSSGARPTMCARWRWPIRGARPRRQRRRVPRRIRFEPAGSAGFGYDPLFEIVEYHRTFARAGRDGQKRAEPPRPGRREADPATAGAGRQRAVGVSVNSFVRRVAAVVSVRIAARRGTSDSRPTVQIDSFRRKECHASIELPSAVSWPRSRRSVRAGRDARRLGRQEHQRTGRGLSLVSPASRALLAGRETAARLAELWKKAGVEVHTGVGGHGHRRHAQERPRANADAANRSRRAAGRREHGPGRMPRRSK